MWLVTLTFIGTLEGDHGLEHTPWGRNCLSASLILDRRKTMRAACRLTNTCERPSSERSFALLGRGHLCKDSTGLVGRGRLWLLAGAAWILSCPRAPLLGGTQ